MKPEEKKVNKQVVEDEALYDKMRNAIISNDIDSVQKIMNEFPSQKERATFLTESPEGGHESLLSVAFKNKKESIYSFFINKEIISGISANKALLLAAKYSVPVIVHNLIDNKKANVNYVDENGDTPLILAAAGKDFSYFNKKVKNGVVEYGTYKSNISVVKALLNNGADINWHNKYGITAAEMALACNNTQIEGYLRNNGWCENVTTQIEKNSEDQNKIIEILDFSLNLTPEKEFLQYIMNSSIDVEGGTMKMTHFAAKNKMVKLLDFMLEKNAHFFISNDNEIDNLIVSRLKKFIGEDKEGSVVENEDLERYNGKNLKNLQESILLNPDEDKLVKVYMPASSSSSMSSSASVASSSVRVGEEDKKFPSQKVGSVKASSLDGQEKDKTDCCIVS
jgi:ankyrin repeat protein